MAQSCPTITAPLQTVYNEIIEGTPIVVTPTVLQMRLVGEGHPFQYVLSYMIRIRSMGTATYIAIGENRLTLRGAARGWP
jgi:hypothetical protein